MDNKNTAAEQAFVFINNLVVSVFRTGDVIAVVRKEDYHGKIHTA